LKKRYNLYYVGDIYNFDGNPWVDLETAKSIIKDNNSKSIDKLNQAKNVDELVNILDGLGFNEDYNFIHSTYAFIFDSILK
jgi:hypothetical protein